MIILGAGAGGMRPSAPTIGTATAGDTTASVAFTASSYIGKGTITYTATSSPGGFTGTGSSSPITVSGLTNGTAYTFTVVGTTNYGVSSVASAASNSITPATQSSYESIATVTVTGADQGALVFDNIPQTYTHLQLRGVARNNTGITSLTLAFNNDNGSNYFRNYIQTNNGATPAGSGSANTTTVFAGTSGYAGSGGSVFAGNIINILDYTNTNIYKSVYAQSGTSNPSGSQFIQNMGGMWMSTSAITKILIGLSSGSDHTAPTSIALYGIKG